MKTKMTIVCALAACAGSASANLSNGDFSAGFTDWFSFGSAFYIDAANPDAGGTPFVDQLKVFGSFTGGQNFNGVAQTISGWNVGDTIEFGAEAFIKPSDSWPGTTPNISFAAINVFFSDGGGGEFFAYNVPTDPVNAASAQDEILSLNNSFVIPLDQAGQISRIEFAIVFQQEDNFDGGAVFWDNAYVNIVPAPAGAAVLAMGGLFASRRRRA